MTFWILAILLLLVCYLFIFRNLTKKYLLFSVPLFSILAFSFYLSLGSPNLDTTLPLEDHSLEDLLHRTEQILQQNPDDARGWLLLARIYNSLGRTADRDRALEELERLKQREQADDN